MAEHGRPVRARRRRGPDPAALLCGLVAVVMAGYGFAGTAPGHGLDPRWALAVVAVVAGVSFILMSLRNSRDGSDD